MVFGAFAISGWAQSATSVAGPVTGFIFDPPSGAVRPMLGIPGAAYLGNAVAAGLVSGAVAPDGSAALGARRTGKLVLYTGLRSGAVQIVNVPGAIAGADLFAWASDASAAAVYSAGAGQAQIVTGLPKTPVVGAPIDLTNVPGRVTQLAFDGQHLLVGVAGDAGGIFLVSASAPPQRLASSPSPSALALAGGNLYFADSQFGQIWQISSYATTPAGVLFANDGGLPVALQVSTDSQRLLVANGNRTLAVYDVASRSVLQSLDLTFIPTRLDRFGDTSVFLMNSGGQGPLYVARDGGPNKAAVYFVPSPARPSQRAPIHPL